MKQRQSAIPFALSPAIVSTSQFPRQCLRKCSRKSRWRLRSNPEGSQAIYSFPANSFFDADTVGLFLKGEDADNELTQAQKSWTLSSVEMIPSLVKTDNVSSGVIMRIKGLSRVDD